MAGASAVNLFGIELEWFRADWARLMEAHYRVIEIANTEREFTGSELGILCHSLAEARALGLEIEQRRVPTLDTAWTAAEQELGGRIPKELAAATKRPWSIAPKQAQRFAAIRRETIRNERLLGIAWHQLRELQAPLAHVLQALAISPPADRLKLLTRLQLDDVVVSLELQADIWLDHWVAEVQGHDGSRLAEDAATVALELLYGGAREVQDLCAYARASKQAALPAGTYAIGADGTALVNAPRPPKWIEIHPFGWNQPLPPFPPRR